MTETPSRPDAPPAGDALREALADLVSWFDNGPSDYGPWIIRAGESGADEAVEAARAALSAAPEPQPARGLRLPSQPATMAWAVIGSDGQIKHVTGKWRNLAKQRVELDDRIERVAIRIVGDAEGGA